jgi:hypothetical protein
MVTESLGYSEFLYRFCLSGTSLLMYCELVLCPINNFTKALELGED